MTDIDEFWKKLDDLGEGEVRKRLAQNVYGQEKVKFVNEWLRLKEKTRQSEDATEEDGHRQANLEIARSSKNATWVSAGASILAVLISIIALYFSYLAFQHSAKDILIFSVERYQGDYKTKLYKFASSEMPALINSYWGCLLVNRGGKAVSIVDMDVEQLSEKGIIKYSLMKGNIYDKEMKPITLPFDIDPSKSVKTYMEVRLAVDPRSFSVLNEKYSFDQSYSIEEIIRFLALRSIDFYGNPVRPYLYNGEMKGFEVEAPQKQQFLNFTVKTGGRNEFLSQAGWYTARIE